MNREGAPSFDHIGRTKGWQNKTDEKRAYLWRYKIHFYFCYTILINVNRCPMHDSCQPNSVYCGKLDLYVVCTSVGYHHRVVCTSIRTLNQSMINQWSIRVIVIVVIMRHHYHRDGTSISIMHGARRRPDSRTALRTRGTVCTAYYSSTQWTSHSHHVREKSSLNSYFLPKPSAWPSGGISKIFDIHSSIFWCICILLH